MMTKAIRNGTIEVHNNNIITITTFETAKLIFVQRLRTNKRDTGKILIKLT